MSRLASIASNAGAATVDHCTASTPPPRVTLTAGARRTAGGAVTLNLLIPSAITVAKALTITGPGASLLTIDGSMIDPTPNSDNGDGRRLFVIDDGFATRAVVTMQGLTLTGADGSGFGGAISNGENLTLRNMVIRNNAITNIRRP